MAGHQNSGGPDKNSKAFWRTPYPSKRSCFDLLPRLSCCVAGNQNLTPVEPQLRETLELLADRLALPMPEAAAPPWLPHRHPLSRVEVAGQTLKP